MTFDDAVQAPAPAPPSRSRRVGRYAAWIAAGALVLATLYIAVMAVLWYLHLEDLRSSHAELKSALAEAENSLEEQSAEHATLVADLDAAHEEYHDTVNIIALARDHTLQFEYLARALETCADERDTHIDFMKERYLYTRASMMAVEDDINDYCRSIRTGVDEGLAIAHDDLPVDEEDD